MFPRNLHKNGGGYPGPKIINFNLLQVMIINLF